MTGARRKSISIVCLLVCSLFCPVPVSSQWSQTNGPFGSTVNSFLVNNSRLFAGTDDGIFVSENGGKTWESVSYFPPGISVISFVSNHSTLFAGTYYNGIFRSSDQGNTWFPSFSGLSLTDGTLNVSSLLVKGSSLFAGTESGIYVSDDDGSSWHLADSSARIRSARTLASVGDTLFMGTFGQGVFRSLNGIQWEASSNGLSQFGLYVSSLLAIDNTLIAGAGDQFTLGRGVYRSTDSGNSWFLSDSGMPEGVGVLSLLHREGTIIAGTTRGPFVSYDLGRHWQALGDELSGIGVRALALTEGYLFGGTQGTGVYRSSLTEPRWEHTSQGLVTTSIDCLLSLGDTVLAGSRGSGLFQTTDASKSWAPMGLTRTNVTSLVKQGQNLYALSGGMVRSTDRGITWQPIPHNFLPSFPPTIYSFTVSDSFLYAGVYHWDGHSSWSWLYRKSHSDSDWKHLSYYGWMSTIIQIATSEDDVFLVVRKLWQEEGDLYHSTDHGDSWRAIDLSGARVHAISAHKNLILVGTSLGIYRSTDRCATWKLSNDGLPQGAIGTAIAMKDGIHFVGTAASGVFFSINEGQHWNNLAIKPVSQGRSIKSLTATSHDIFAGTEGRGVWSLPKSAVTTVSHPPDAVPPDAFMLHQNYPNPFNPATEIRYQISEVSHVTLTVFDVLGREVATLVNGEKEAGTHRLRWDATGLPSGVYLYRLKANGFVETRKMILTR